MELRVDLLKLPGAEAAVMDGVEGVFIPKIPNFSVVLFRKKKFAFLKMATFPSKGKHHQYNVKLRMPMEYIDYAVASEKFNINRTQLIGTADDRAGKNGREGVVSMADFEDLLGG